MRKREYDFWLLFTVLVLLALGTIMVFSASSYTALSTQGNKYHYLIRQVIWVTVGLIAMFVVSNIDYRRIALSSPILLVICVVLLVLVRIPGIGSNVNGSWRWFNFGPASFQPSEFAKIALILFLSFSLSKNSHRLQYFFTGLLPYLMVVGLIDLLLLLEPHKSATLLITMVSAIILFCAGARIWHFIVLGVPAVAGGIYIIMKDAYSMQRILAFWDPFKYPQDIGYQIINSLYAIASGSVFGRGLGKSLQKYLYLPEPHNDFIFSILAEELGFVGALTVVILFMLFIWRGLKIAMNAPDMMGSLIAAGITSLVALEAVINIAVVTSTIPATGMPLPFFSYGGTSLVFLLIAIGILLNISKGASQMPVRSKGIVSESYAGRDVTSRKAGEFDI